MIDSASNATAAATATSSSRATLSANFDTFLSLLTAQLKNQDPLDPIDSAAFTQQLVQYSQVEQQIQTNDQLDSLKAQIAASSLASSVGYIGRSAAIDTATGVLGEEGLAWSFAAPEAVGAVRLDVLAPSGAVVRSETTGASTAARTFAWDGKTNQGANAPPGRYGLRIVAVNAEGAAAGSQVALLEKIKGVAPGADGPRFLTASGEHTLGDILRIEN